MSDPLYINVGAASSAVGTATIAADGTFTLAAHGLVNGQPVRLDSLTGGASSVFREGTTYYVLNSQTNTFTLVSIPGDVVITLGSSGGANVHMAVPHYTAAELRRADGGLMFKGVSDRFGARQGIHPSNDPAVTVSGTTWTVQDITGAVYPGLTDQDGPYSFAHPEESGSLDPADGSQDRIDALDLQIQDDDTDSSGFRRARVVPVTGTPGSPPSAPAVTSNALRLATIDVPSGGSPSPSVATLAVFEVAAGGVLPVRGTSELPAAGRYTGMAAFRQDVLAPVYWDTGSSAWVTGWPATVEDEQTAGFTFTNTSFATTGGAVCGVAFVAPVTGRVKISTNALIDVTAGTNARAHCVPVVRTGNVVGSGSPVFAANSDNGIGIAQSQTGPDQGGARPRMGVVDLVTGLTAGNDYNVQLEHRVTSQTGELVDRKVIVEPAT